MSKPELVQQFNNTLMKKLESTLTENSALGKWAKLRSTIYSTALDTFGKKTSKTSDQFDSKVTVRMPVIKDKWSAHFRCINLSNSKNIQALKDSRQKVQQTARICVNEFWVELSQKIQLSANTGNIRGITRHQESYRTSPDNDLFYKVIYWRATHGENQANGKIGGTLLKYLFSSYHKTLLILQVQSAFKPWVSQTLSHASRNSTLPLIT